MRILYIVAICIRNSNIEIKLLNLHMGDINTF